MSDEERKFVRDPALYGKQDPSTEAEEEGVEEEQSVEAEVEFIEEEETGSAELEGEYIEEEEDNGSTLNGNSSLEEELTTIEEEGSGERSPPTVKESPTVEEKRPALGTEYSAIMKKYPALGTEYSAITKKYPPLGTEYSAIMKKYPAFHLDFLKANSAIGMDSAIMKDDPSIEDFLRANSAIGMDSAIMKDDPAIEAEYLAILRDLPEPATEKKDSSKEDDKNSPTEKECQTIEQGIDIPIEDGREPFDMEVTSVVHDQGFYDKGCQTTSFADSRPLPIDKQIQTTLRLERSFSTSSLNASKGSDSGNSLKECPSIEEEPAPEPVEIIRVRAQVMIRNDSTGGWVPEGCGGMSTVTINKIELPRKPGDSKVYHRYTIEGTRLSDKRVSLHCIIRSELEYNKVMPTFHHWKSGHEKFGLTFQTTTEARIFHKGLRDSYYAYKRETDPNALPLKSRGDDDEDFLAFTKPAEPRPQPPSPEPVYELPDYLLPNAEEEERIQFMQLTSLPEYFYQDYRANDQSADEKLRRRPIHRTRKPLKYFGIIRRTTRLRCRYCHELYEEEENTRGQCRYAPSTVKKIIDHLTCMRCAKFFVQDCMVDPDEDYSHPCTCRDEGYCGLRWVGLCLLSLVLPCMLFYPPMKGCYDCGVHCGVCGGRHKEKVKDPQQGGQRVF